VALLTMIVGVRKGSSRARARGSHGRHQPERLPIGARVIPVVFITGSTT
jgi:hypothetical protein